MQGKSRNEILEQIKKHDVQLIRFLYTDADGVIRGYCSTAQSIEGDLEKGHEYAMPMPYFSALDNIVSGSRFGPVGGLIALPDPSTFKILPYKNRSAAMICKFVTLDAFEETPVCARTILDRVIRESEFDVKASFENEFYLLARDTAGNLVPADRSLCFATSGMNAAHDTVLEIVDALTAQGIHVEKYYPEYGPGQQEFAVRYDDGLVAADNQVYFRETVRAIAADHGLVASFMPKPFQELSGSGAHIHVSLWNDDTNLFYSGDPSVPYSDIARSFIGGVLKHVEALCAFTAATITSYKRIIPQHWAAAYACYGLENKEAAVRIIPGCKGNEANGINIEFKPADPTCNPYLALAALLAAGFDGIRRNIDLGEPTTVDPATLTEGERARLNIRPLPATLIDAVEALERDELFRDAMGEVMFSEYALLKRYNWNQFMSHVTQWEFDRYVDIF